MITPHRSALATAVPPLSPSRIGDGAGELGVSVVVAAGAGTVLGSLDLYLQLSLAYPWADLANSAAVWAVAAFVCAVATARHAAVGALVGVVMLTVAVEAYYVAAIISDRSDVATLWAPSTVTWLEFGVLAGVVFGLAGVWVRSGGIGRAVLSFGVALGAMLGQAAYWVTDPVSGPNAAVAVAGLGVIVVAGVGVVIPRPWAALAGCVTAIPVALVFALAFQRGLAF